MARNRFERVLAYFLFLVWPLLVAGTRTPRVDTIMGRPVSTAVPAVGDTLVVVSPSTWTPQNVLPFTQNVSVANEGTDISAPVRRLNFIGASVDAVVAGDQADITISVSGTGGTVVVKEDSTVIDASAATLQFWAGQFDITSAGSGTVLIKIATDGVTSSALADDAVDTAAIQLGAVALDRIQDASANSRLVGSGQSGSGSPYSELSLGPNLWLDGTTLKVTATASSTLNTQVDGGSIFTTESLTLNAGGGVALTSTTAGTTRNVTISADGLTVDVYTSGSGTWTKPAGAKLIEVTMVGGGGGGGSGMKGAAGTGRCGGGGGGAGSVLHAILPADSFNATEDYSVGTGGTGGTTVTASTTNGSAGSAGGTSSFGSSGTRQLIATGGGGGGGGTAATGTAGTAQFSGEFYSGKVIGSAGGAAGTAGAAGSAGGAITTVPWPTGGGGGGGVNSSNAAASGAAGGGMNTGAFPGWGTSLAGGTAGTAGVAGGDGSARAGQLAVGTGGGGGGASTTGDAGSGGDGGGLGAGGGGGGAAVNSVGNSGKGGDGSAGIIIVVTHF